MDRPVGAATTSADKILETDDLYYRAGGIASWTQYATYIIQPSCPGMSTVNQVRQIDMPAGSDPAELLDEAKEFFREIHVPSLEIRIDQRTAPSELQDFLDEQGFHLETDELYSTPANGELVHKAVSVLSAHEIGVIEDLEGVLTKWDASCLDEELCSQAAEVRRFRREAGILEEFVGYYEGEPACTFATIQSGPMGRIKDFYIDPEFLGEEVEVAVFGMGIQHLFDRGVKSVGLAGEDLSGLNYLLKRFRFERVGETRCYRTNL